MWASGDGKPDAILVKGIFKAEYGPMEQADKVTLL